VVVLTSKAVETLYHHVTSLAYVESIQTAVEDAFGADVVVRFACAVYTAAEDVVVEDVVVEDVDVEDVVVVVGTVDRPGTGGTVLIDVAGPAVHDVVERMDSSVVESVAWQA
jgi:hypothetical protein